ncbi:MAG: RepB family plasmid replication initiator protein [Dehalococcoidia bacterium]|nr:RepB family plasmid replication initiator protein [Dehalococcoidia bacterium]
MPTKHEALKPPAKVIYMDQPESSEQQSALVVKSNYLVEASYKLSLQEQRIILMMVSMISPGDEDFARYRINIRQFTDLVGLKGESSYQEVKKITKKLLKRVMSIYSVQEDSELQVSWISSAKFWHKKGYVELCFDPNLKPYLVKLQEFFTKYSLQYILPLKSAYAIRIYELLKQYEAIGKRRLTIKELRKYLGIGEDEYRQYGHLKTRILGKAQSELNAKTDLKIRLEEEKIGRRVTTITFFIKSRRPKDAILPEADIKNPVLYQRLIHYFCLPKQDAKKTLEEYEEEYILSVLSSVEERFQRGEIRDIGPYTLGALKKGARQKSLFEVEKEKRQARAKEEAQKKRAQEALKREFEAYRTQCIEEHKRSLGEAKFAQIEAIVKQEVEAKYGSGHIGFNAYVRLGLNKRLASLAGVPSFEEWQATRK